MDVVKKVAFPYLLSDTIRKNSDADTVIFFGTDFYNLPKGSDRTLFIQRTNGMLAYIRKHFSGSRLLYQPHPNETDEYALLDLAGFEVGKKTIADLLLWEEASRIAAVFASCSWAAASAYAMGHRSGVFLDLLKGAIPDEALTGYRSYFAGFPDSFFIRSFEQELPPYAPARNDEERRALASIENVVGNAKTAWFLSSDPAYAVQAAIVGKELKRRGIQINLLKVRHPRWSILEGASFYAMFDHIFDVPRQWYTARPKNISALVRNVIELRRLPIRKGDALISFAHTQFAENCILSWYPELKKILMLESRWYHFTYEEEGRTLPRTGFHTSLGTRLFNFVVEPLLRLHRSVYKEYKDGRVLNINRYQAPLEAIYDGVFVMVPPK